MYASPLSTYCESAIKAVLEGLGETCVVKTVSFYRWELVLLRMKQVRTFIYSALLGLSECKSGKSKTFNDASSN